jgi:hypothetical protein
MRSSFAPVDMLIDETMKGYDSHFLQLTNQQKQTKGMIVFNQDSQEPTRVNLYNLTANGDFSCYEEVLDLGLDYIWKTMHCSTIRIYLHHFKQKEDKLAVYAEVKDLLKQRRFKWKTLKNESKHGIRFEVLEGQNLHHKE